MDTDNQTGLELDPSVMVNRDAEQSTTSIDQKYGVSLFEDPNQQYNLYSYDNINQQIYEDDTNYQLDIDSNQFTLLYTTPEVYSVDTGSTSIEVTNLLYFVLIVQILVVGYFVIRIIKVKGKI